MENKLNNILSECFYNIIKFGKRSNMRVEPLHKFIGESLSENIVYEKKLSGFYYDKKVDLYNESNKTAYEIKFITGNYKQNGNNYFENMNGATDNLNLAGYRVVQIIILPIYLPYYNNRGILKKIEYITPKDIIKYKKLMEKGTETKPDNMFLYLIDTGNEQFLNKNIGNILNEKELNDSYNIKSIKCLDENVNDFLNIYSNFDNFIKKEK